MRISESGLELIKHFEAAAGPQLRAYRDSGGVLTIGYGHTGPDVYEGMTITRDEAEALLRSDVKRAEQVVEAAVQVPLTIGEFDALVSFVFNVGPGRRAGTKGPGDPGKSGFVRLANGQPSTLLRKLNDSDYDGAAEEFMKWTKQGEHILSGLIARRAAERARFEETA